MNSYEKQSINASRYWLDIDYVGDGIIGHKLDIHLPSDRTGPFPVVLAIYGSAWFSNSSKANVFKEGLGQTLLNEGYAVVNINHRSSRDAIFPAQIHDVKAAIRFLRGNCTQFNLDTSFLAVTGWSSGGHLAAMTGVTSGLPTASIQNSAIDLEGSLGDYTGYESTVDAVVDWFGPTDFLVMDECGSSFSHDGAESPESSLVGGPIQENQLSCAMANPISYVSRISPPMIIFHGDEDPLVPLCQSERLQMALEMAGIQNEFFRIKGGAHGPGVLIEKYYREMLRFLNEVRKK